MSETSLSLARALAELAQARRRGKRRRALLADRTLQLLVQDLVGRAHCGRDDAAGRGAAYADDQERGVPSGKRTLWASDSEDNREVCLCGPGARRSPGAMVIFVFD
jgi:hypothetical protein